MKAINSIVSYFLMLKASAYQGREQFHEVIRLSLKAKALNPRSKAALTFLADDYKRLKDYDHAKNVLEEALGRKRRAYWKCYSVYTRISQEHTAFRR